MRRALAGLVLAALCWGQAVAAPAVVQMKVFGATSTTPTVTFTSNVSASNNVYAVLDSNGVVTPACTYNSLSMTISATAINFNLNGGSTMVSSMYFFYAPGAASVNVVSCTINGVLNGEVAAWEVSGLPALAPLYAIVTSACTTNGCTATTTTQTFSGGTTQFMACLGLNAGSNTVPSASGLSASGSTLASGTSDGSFVTGFNTAGWSTPANTDSCIDKSATTATAYGGIAALFGWDTAAASTFNDLGQIIGWWVRENIPV